jgi:hypothetical protein
VYSVDLCWVGYNASVPNHEAQEQSGGDTEDALCWVELPLELSEIGEDFGEVGDELVFHYGLDDHIVYIGLDILPDLGFEALLDHLLVCCSSVFQAKGHDLVAIDAVSCYDRCFVFVVGMQGYLVIS